MYRREINIYKYTVIVLAHQLLCFQLLFPIFFFCSFTFLFSHICIFSTHALQNLEDAILNLHRCQLAEQQQRTTQEPRAQIITAEVEKQR